MVEIDERLIPRKRDKTELGLQVYEMIRDGGKPPSLIISSPAKYGPK